MRSICVIFTCERDYAIAEIAAASAQRLGHDILMVVSQTDKKPNFQYKTICSATNRKGNLRGGAAWVKEQLSILRNAAIGYDWVIKLDSDTIIS